MRSLKIVHCANFSTMKDGKVFYAIDRKISNGLIINGHFVYDFSYRDIARCSGLLGRKFFGTKRMNEKLLKTVQNIKPDLLLLGHSEIIDVETLKKVKELFPRMKIAMWWVDSVEPQKIAHIKKRIKLLDAFFSTTGETFVKEKIGYGKNIFFFPNICDPSIERYKGFEQKDYRFDLLFAGSFEKRRDSFIQKLQQLPNLRLALYGVDKPKIFGSHYYEAIKESKIVLNYSKFNDIELYSSDRIIQILGNGAMAISPKIPKFSQLFSGEEIVYFDDFKDFEEKVNYYLMHENERKEIAYRGWKKAHSYYNNAKITHFMIEQIFKD